MNYILEITAFEQWLETHYLPISPQLLWYKLMHFCNISGWSEWVTVDNLRLMAAMQMSREATLIKARDDLIKAGLIEYQKGKKGSPNRYRIVPIAGRNTFRSEVQSAVKSGNTFKSEVQSGVNRVAESGGIYKQNKTKTEYKGMPPIPPACRFGEFWEAYPNRQRRGLAEKAYCDLLLSAKVTEEELVAAAGNYSEHCRVTGDRACFPNNWLEKCVFEDYLPGRYVRPQGHKGNMFSKFRQNSYDFDQLEQELLGN